MTEETRKAVEEVASGWMIDDSHSMIRPGDLVLAEYCGLRHQRFEVLSDTGTGMFEVRRPDGSVSPMRPSTILSFAEGISR